MLRGLTAASAATRNPLSIAPTASIQKAVTMLSRFNVGSLLVAPGDPSDVQGILTERDILMSFDPAVEQKVGDVMTAEVNVASGRQPLEQCLRTMMDKHFRHLPVLGTGGKIDAILSMRDVCKALVERFEADKAKRPVATLGDVVENSTLNEAPHESTVGDVVKAMRASHTGSTVVPIDAGAAARGQAFGIFTERDFLHLLASETDGARAWDAPVVEHMTAGGELVWAEPSFLLADALTLINAKGFRNLPVVRAHEEGTSLAPPTLRAVLSMQVLVAHAVWP